MHMLSLKIKMHSNVACPLLTSANYRFYGGTFSKEQVSCADESQLFANEMCNSSVPLWKCTSYCLNVSLCSLRVRQFPWTLKWAGRRNQYFVLSGKNLNHMELYQSSNCCGQGMIIMVWGWKLYFRLLHNCNKKRVSLTWGWEEAKVNVLPFIYL